MNSRYEVLSNVICLIYHEGRNIRWPIRAGKAVLGARFEGLLKLPDNSREAWRRMKRARELSAAAPSASALVRVFEGMYGIALEELFRTFDEPIWKHSARGGNAWAKVAERVLALIPDWDSLEPSRIEQYQIELLRMKHNTGTIEEKLVRLEGVTGSSVSSDV